MRKIRSMNSEGGEKSFKEEKGYTKAGSIFKSRATKDDLERKQKRLNSFSESQNKEMEQQKRLINKTPEVVDKVEFNEYGLPRGGQVYRKQKRNGKPKYRSTDN